MSQTTTERRTQRANHNGSSAQPPYEPELEKAVIGAVLLRPELYEPVAALIGAQDFYVPGHAAVFATIASMRTAQDPIDPVTVAARCDTTTLADLLSWQANSPSSSHAAGYAEIIAEASQQRRAGVLAYELAEAVRGRDTAAILSLITAAPERVGHAKGRQALEWEDVAAALRGELPTVEPYLLYRNDDRALIYPGRLHWVQAEPGRAKSWLAKIAALEQMTFGEHVIYLDYETNLQSLSRHLRKLGLEDDVGGEFLHYSRPGAHSPAVIAQLASDLERWRPALCILDGVAKSLQRNGYSEDKRDEVGQWIDRVCRPITNAGVALVAIDHVTKNPDTRGRYAVGGGNKLAEVDGAAYSMKRVRAFSHNQAGEYQLIVEKDKEGGVGPEGSVAGVLRLEEDHNHVITWTLEAPTDENTENPGLRIIRERILTFLGDRPTQEFSSSDMRDHIKGKGTAVTEVLARLVESGDIETRRVGRSIMHRIADAKEPPEGGSF